MSLYNQLADKLQYVLPDFYKRRYFKKLVGLNADNIFDRKVEPEMLWLRNLLKKNSVFLDIGSNVGSYLFLLEKTVKAEHIYAFEPNKKLYRRLVRIFPDIHIFPIALSDENTFAEFKIPIMNGKEVSSRGTLQVDLKENGEIANHIEKVKVMRLDDWAEIEHFTKLDFIKIDVEGNEMQTLRGAEKTIRKFKPTLMVEMEQRHHKEPLWNLISEIETWGYEANFLDREKMDLQKLTKDFIESQDASNLKIYKNYINNIIFVPLK